MKKIWLNRIDSFQKAEVFDDRYNLSLSAEERLSNAQILRGDYFKINKDLNYKTPVRYLKKQKELYYNVSLASS